MCEVVKYIARTDDPHQKEVESLFNSLNHTDEYLEYIYVEYKKGISETHRLLLPPVYYKTYSTYKNGCDIVAYRFKRMSGERVIDSLYPNHHGYTVTPDGSIYSFKQGDRVKRQSKTGQYVFQLVGGRPYQRSHSITKLLKSFYGES